MDGTRKYHFTVFCGVNIPAARTSRETIFRGENSGIMPNVTEIKVWKCEPRK
jgi:hypothetical protein